MSFFVSRFVEHIFWSMTLCTLATGCTGIVKHDGRVDQEHVSQVKLIQDGVSLPKGARELYLYDHDGLEDLQKIRFDSSLNDARDFAADLLGVPAKKGYDPVIEFHGPQVDWWIKDFPSEAEGGEVNSTQITKKVVIVAHGDTARVWAFLATR